MIKYETERTIVREVKESDLEGFYAMDSDPEVHIYLGNNPVKSRAESAMVIQNLLQQYKEYGMGRLAVIDKETGDFMGWTGIKYETVVREEYNYYDLGYRFRRKYWGKGIATETAIASLDYGFNTLGLKKICGGAEIDHGASNAILKKIGLQFVETFHFDGIEHNWYELRREDYLKIQS